MTALWQVKCKEAFAPSALLWTSVDQSILNEKETAPCDRLRWERHNLARQGSYSHNITPREAGELAKDARLERTNSKSTNDNQIAQWNRQNEILLHFISTCARFESGTQATCTDSSLHLQGVLSCLVYLMRAFRTSAVFICKQAFVLRLQPWFLARSKLHFL